MFLCLYPASYLGKFPAYKGIESSSYGVPDDWGVGPRFIHPSIGYSKVTRRRPSLFLNTRWLSAPNTHLWLCRDESHLFCKTYVSATLKIMSHLNLARWEPYCKIADMSYSSRHLARWQNPHTFFLRLVRGTAPRKLCYMVPHLTGTLVSFEFSVVVAIFQDGGYVLRRSPSCKIAESAHIYS